jgi:ABC-type lipoprotein export system ATPase subunit
MSDHAPVSSAPAPPPDRRPSPPPAAPSRARYGEGSQIVCDNLVKIYKVAELEVVALQGLDLLVGTQRCWPSSAPPAAGKSTLLNILGGLDVPSAGRAVVAGHDLGQLSGRERTHYRRSAIGFVWQQTARNLLPYLDAVANVELPMLLDGVGAGERRRRATELLELVGLSERLHHRPGALSGGEQQRVAIAVALANQPRLLLADEPTGELDTHTSEEIFELLRRLNRELGTTIVIVTHDPLVSEQVQRTVAIRDGRIEHRDAAPHPAGRGRRARDDRRGVRGARQGGPAAAAAGPRRGTRPGATRPAAPGARPHHHLARRAAPARTDRGDGG